MATKFHSLPKTLKMKELPVESIKLNAHPLSRIIESKYMYQYIVTVVFKIYDFLKFAC